MRHTKLLSYLVILLYKLSESSAEDNELDLGCFKDNTTRRVTGHYFRDGNLSTKQCIQECKSRGYVYAALQVGIECFCGSGQVALKEKVVETDCNFYCAGERSKRCGGNWRFNLFSVQNCEKVEASNDEVIYIGCFKDKSERKLVGHYFKDAEQLTHDKCIKECQNHGFLYAGLQGGEECYCGNQQNILQERASENECNSPCNGDNSKMCGGNMRMTLYTVGRCVQGSSDHMYLGCFKDNSNRKLSGHYLRDTKMTPEKCVEACKSKNLFYAGLQVGIECYCGNQRTALDDKVLDEECNFPCTGDNSKKCGSNWRNTIYSTSNVEKRSYRGCYKDENNRKIKGQYFIIDYPLDGMTPKKCLYLCGQYKFMYAGLQVGVECYCGNQQLIEADKVPEAECNFGCTGDYSKKCGGNWRNTIYSTGYTSEDVKSPLKETQILGCYMDSKERKFKGYFHKSETMLPEKCVNLCHQLGYLYAALQAGSECYCGDTQPTPADKVNKNDCQFPCFGDYSKRCGGLWRNDIYSTEFVNTGIVSTTDSSYVYKGCYKPSTQQDSDHYQVFGYKFTPKICVEFCKRHGHPYAALYAGTTCKCLSQSPPPETLMDDKQCITKCTGDNTKICGGLNMNSVYETGVADIISTDYSKQYLGCYNDNSEDLNKSYYFTSQKMSVGMCITVCKYYGYLFAGISNGNGCNCGDKQLQDASKTADNSCNLPCSGESNKNCGGNEKQAVYNTGNTGPEPKVADFGVEHVGCFREQVKYGELRAYIVDYEDQLDPKNCVYFCSRLGFKYTGLLAGSQCLCGNKEPVFGFMVQNQECTTRCTGSKDNICGGNARVTVYKTSIQNVDGEIDIKSRYLGCFKDSGDPRALRGSFKHMDKLTPWKCVKECKKKNYLYAGLQSGSDCYCGDQHPQFKDRLPESSCSFQCFGDVYKFCGGNWANTIYHTSSTGSEARIADIGYRYLGCYRDQENPRQLSSYNYNFGDHLTPVACVELCKKYGYFYAGLQYGDRCFCGDTHPIPLDIVDEEECNSKCTGDVKKLCGGNRRNIVHFTGNHVYASIDNEGLNYLGCYKDEEEQRHLQGYSQNFNEILIPSQCVALCKNRGYLYAGLQNSSFCYCGDQYPSPSDKVGDTQCNSRCTGATTKICGGILRNTIYTTGHSGSSLATVADAGYQYLGCFTTQSSVEFTQQSRNFNDSLTPQKCIDFCKKAGHLYCGLHYSTWCYCGDSSPPQSEKVNEGECSSKCLGDVSKICGGPNTLTGYITTKKLDGSEKESIRCVTSKTTVNGGQTCSGAIVFEENFSKPLSSKKWNHIVEFADEPDFSFVVYNSNRANSYTADNKLIIKPSILPADLVKHGELNLTECTAKKDPKQCSRHAITYLILPPVQTARLATRNSFSFRYGIVEIIAKLPVGDWIIPEIWLEPKERAYGPDYTSGRVNIALSRGNRDLNLNGRDLSCHHLECGVAVGVGEVIKEDIVTRDLQKCWHEDFHNYTLIWTPENMIFFIDGIETSPLLPNEDVNLSNYLGFSNDVSSLWRFGSKIAPFDKEFYLHVGLSVGGIRSFPDKVLSNGRAKPWKNKELRSMLNFWRAQKDWEPTWVGGSALEIKQIKVTSL